MTKVKISGNSREIAFNRSKVQGNEISENQAYPEFRVASESSLSSEEPIFVKLEMTR